MSNAQGVLGSRVSPSPGTALLAVGVYGPGAIQSVKAAVALAAGTWVLAAILGLALRSTSLFHGDAPPSFALVVTGIGVASFSAWRGLVASLRQ